MPDRVRPALAQLALAVLVLAGIGVVSGFVWEWLWTAPVGEVVDHVWVAQDEANLRRQFSGTGWYAVVAGVAGLLGGAVVALFVDRFPLVTLLGVVLGSALGAFLMLRVGVALGPDDPTRGALGVSGGTPYLSMPAGALVAMAMVFLGLSAARRDRDEVTTG